MWSLNSNAFYHFEIRDTMLILVSRSQIFPSQGAYRLEIISTRSELSETEYIPVYML